MDYDDYYDNDDEDEDDDNLAQHTSHIIFLSAENQLYF